MEEKIIDQIKIQMEGEEISPNSSQSRDWFFDKIKEIADMDVDRNRLKSQLPVSANQFNGMMYMFWYMPKHKMTLPYYDRFPLVIMLEHYKGGFLGLNLHYLPIDLRQKLFYGLLPRATQRDFTHRTRLKIDYNYLQGKTFLRAYKPCVKRYLTKHIIGKIAHVPAPEWEIATHLPTASWRKATETKVHKDSRIIARKTT